MMADWNSIGRVVIKNSKGIYLKGDGLYFHINDTAIDLDLAKIFLEKKKKAKNKKPDVFTAYKTKAEWNAVGHIVKKGSRGVYSKSEETILFSFYNTFINRPLAKKFLRQHQYYLTKKSEQNEMASKIIKNATSDIPF